jgi:indolepyruvate ferredoxin oxidoreductase beta subunit
VRIVEFLKPGIEEIASLLPPGLARRVIGLAERRRWLGRVYFGMEIETSSVAGFLRLRLLAKLKWWRPRSFRFAEEQAQIEAWLRSVREAALLSPALALEVAECARLVKGYGETHRRGLANYHEIVARLIHPALTGALAPALAADAIASARTAALADPEGDSLARCLAEVALRAPLQEAAE